MGIDTNRNKKLKKIAPRGITSGSEKKSSIIRTRLLLKCDLEKV
jgi:hypothetical protein